MSAMKALRAGIAGAGLMGRWHANAVRRTGGRVAAVIDTEPAAAQSLAASYSGATAFSSFERMLNESQLDVLHICSPLVTHFQIAERAIDAGLHLLVEKPLTPQGAEAERLYDLAASRRVILCPVHQFLFQDGTLKARRLLPRIGRIIHLQGVFCSAGGTGQPEELDAITADILPHPLSLMQAFLPEGLSGTEWETAWPRGGEFRAIGERSGVSLGVFISMNSRPTVCSLQIFGADGTIHVNLFHGYAVIEPGNVSRLRKMTHPFDLAARSLSGAAINLCRRVIQWQPAYPGLQRLVGDFYRAAQDATEAPISREDSLTVAHVRDNLLRRGGPAGSTSQFRQ